MPKYSPKREESVEAWELVEKTSVKTGILPDVDDTYGEPGDFMVRDKSGNFFIMKRSEFLAKYEKQNEVNIREIQKIIETQPEPYIKPRNPWRNPPYRPQRPMIQPIPQPWEHQIWCARTGDETTNPCGEVFLTNEG